MGHGRPHRRQVAVLKRHRDLAVEDLERRAVQVLDDFVVRREALVDKGAQVLADRLRPCQSATPRLHTAYSAKQSKPLPNVLSSISFHMANSHSGGEVFVKVIVLIARSWLRMIAAPFDPHTRSMPAGAVGSANLPRLLAKLCEGAIRRGYGNLNA